MKSSILIVIFDFFVCSLLLSVTNEEQSESTMYIYSTVIEQHNVSPEFTAESIATMEAEWEMEYAEVEELVKEDVLVTKNVINIQEDLDAAVQEKKRLESQVDQLTQDSEEKLRQLSDLELSSQQKDKDLSKIEEEFKIANDKIKIVENELKVSVQTSAELKETTDQLQGRINDTEEKLADARESQTVLKNQAKQLVQEKENLTARAQSLEEAISSQQKTIEKLQSDAQLTRGGHGGFVPIIGARLEIKVEITEYDKLDPNDHFERAIHPLVLTSGNERYVIVPSSDLGMGWDELSETTGSKVTTYKIGLSRRGENPVSANFSGVLEILGEAPNLALIRLPQEFVTIEPLIVMGRVDFLKKGLDEGSVFKINKLGESFDVSFAPELDDPRFIRIKAPFVNQPRDIVSKNNNPPAIGDYVVSPTNQVLAVMVDGTRALVLDESILTSISQKIPITDKGAIPGANKKWLDAQKK